MNRLLRKDTGPLGKEGGFGGRLKIKKRKSPASAELIKMAVGRGSGVSFSHVRFSIDKQFKKQHPLDCVEMIKSTCTFCTRSLRSAAVGTSSAHAQSVHRNKMQRWSALLLSTPVGAGSLRSLFIHVSIYPIQNVHT